MDSLDKIRWFHTIDLNGTITPGKKDTIKEKDLWELKPEWFKDQRVLDVGAWDGFYSFYAESCEAKDVLAIDSFVWNKINIGKKGFDFCHNILNSKVRSQICKVKDISKELGVFDRVIFCGVFYHLRDPFSGLINATSVLDIGGEIILESYREQDEDPAYMKFFGKEILSGDKSNFWSPNTNCLLEMFDMLGFEVYKQIPLEHRIVMYAKKIREPELRIFFE